MEHKRCVKISKYLSRHLRHDPGRLGLELATGGWVDVDVLLDACRRNRFPVTRQELEEVVAQNDKQRFSFDDSGGLIRANQGHSVDVDLELEEAIPPETLYHGTAEKNLAAILNDGLRKMNRHHVHLSADVETALRVGKRHGAPIVFIVDTVCMVADGHTFYCSANGVWLVDAVAPSYLQSQEAIQ